MATIKERGTDKWNMSKATRRSARNFVETEKVGKAKKKNTRKWCKGREGRKHVLALYNKYTWSHSRKCVNCGKELWGPLKREDFDFVEKRWEDFH
ncbi:hypothetical protein SEA_STARBOW_197 [Streptomyces phage Starbow]|uniref:Uncharacterized protein n=3 Tax=Streptomyces virus Karimac TaxID=2846401 RepID=A0A5Q2WQ88_9CAUD|nr:hypothetical protein SEA_STARBOW_197 [Streptomyces phage Starbow]QGH79927.1 hypothetical protein SEA_BORDEAUX_198 [Streptomyces phage Bordeaux]QRI45844.1 hypothetical protein SEA_BATTUTA_197 [Streptomyces phage Battuta]